MKGDEVKMRVLRIERNSEAEERFLELLKITDTVFIGRSLHVIDRNVFYSYTIDDETYEKIRQHLLEERA